jgi:cytochrome c2
MKFRYIALTFAFGLVALGFVPGCSGESITTMTGSGIGQGGRSLFFSRTKGGCSVCHKVTPRDLVGPGLAGVSRRHSREWLVKWVTDPAQTWRENGLETRGMKKRLRKEIQAETKMKLLNPLTGEEIEAIVDYLTTL